MKRFLLLCLVSLLLSACQPSLVTSTSLPSTSTSSPDKSPTLTLTASSLPTSAPIMPTIAPNTFTVCSPLEEETLESLSKIISKPLDIPGFGQDTGHHGVDFTYFQRGNRSSIQGVSIYAILYGKVVMTLPDNLPYGYTIMIETPLAELPETLQASLAENYLPVPEDPHYRLYCPQVIPPNLTGEYSVYHLYAHMENKPAFNPGSTIACGEKLGTVGSTGYSSNPHLHLETRLGPSGANFTQMAHYENSNSVEQMSTYCLWRLSGYYQLFNPFILFNAAD